MSSDHIEDGDERPGAHSYSEVLARSSSSASTHSARGRLSSKTSVASSSAGNRDSTISNDEAASGRPPEPENGNFRKRLGALGENLVHPIMEVSDASFSQQLPEVISSLHTRGDIEFLLRAVGGQCKTMLIKSMKLILSNDSYLINSTAFIEQHHGYKFCLQAGFGKENISIGVKLMKGERDKQLAWPFNMIVVLRLMNQYGDTSIDTVKMFRCEKNGSHLKGSLMRPKTDINAPMGYPVFITRQRLLKDGFVRNDTMLLKCYLFPKDAKIKLPSECPSIIK